MQELSRMDDLEFYVLSYRPDGRPIKDDSISRWMTAQKADYYKVDLARLAPTIPFLSTLAYDNSTGSFNGLDSTFYAKLVDLRNLKIFVGSSSQLELIDFLKSCHKNIIRIQILDFNDESMNDFFALLPQQCPYLRYLRVHNEGMVSFFDLEFAFELPELYRLEFTKPDKLRCDKSDYRSLQQKLESKREKIFNRMLVFSQDRYYY